MHVVLHMIQTFPEVYIIHLICVLFFFYFSIIRICILYILHIYT